MIDPKSTARAIAALERLADALERIADVEEYKVKPLVEVEKKAEDAPDFDINSYFRGDLWVCEDCSEAAHICECPEGPLDHDGKRHPSK